MYAGHHLSLRWSFSSSLLPITWACWETFGLFCEKSVTNSVVQVQKVIFRFLTNFVKPYLSSKAPSCCFRAGWIFVRHWNLTNLSIFVSHEWKENVGQENLILFFKMEVFQTVKGAKCVIFVQKSNNEMEDSWIQDILHKRLSAQVF